MNHPIEAPNSPHWPGPYLFRMKSHETPNIWKHVDMNVDHKKIRIIKHIHIIWITSYPYIIKCGIKRNNFISISHRIHGAGIYANIWGILMVNVTIYSIHGFYGILETQTLIITVGFNPQGVPLSCCSWPLIAAAVRANEEIPTWQSGTGDMSISWVKKGQLLTTSCVFRCLFVDVFCRLWVVWVLNGLGQRFGRRPQGFGMVVHLKFTRNTHTEMFFQDHFGTVWWPGCHVWEMASQDLRGRLHHPYQSISGSNSQKSDSRSHGMLSGV